MFEECRLEGNYTLSSGRASNVFYDFDLLTPVETAQYVEQLVTNIPPEIFDEIDFIASPALGGIVPGFLVAFAKSKSLVIVDKKGKVRGPEFKTGKYLIVDDVITSYLAAKKIIAVLPGCSYIGVASYIFRGVVANQIMSTFYLSRKEVEEESVERWMPVLGWEDQYSVSNSGRVRSEDRVVIQKNDVVKRLKGQILSTLYDSQGYPQISLGREKKVLIHTLVLESFIAPRPDNLFARHLNGDKTDNSLENLMWDTMSNNQADKIKHGTNNAGTKHYRSKFTEEDIRTIRHLREQGAAYVEIAKRFSVTDGAIKDICYKRNWKCVE